MCHTNACDLACVGDHHLGLGTRLDVNASALVSSSSVITDQRHQTFNGATERRAVIYLLS